MGVGIDGQSLLLAGDATPLTLHVAGDTWRACIGVGIDGHGLLLAGDATLLTRRR